MATKKKVNDPITVLIDTEPEQPNLMDSTWEIKLVDLATNVFTDISNDVTVQELQDNTISNYSSIPSASSTALAGTRVVNVTNGSEIKDSDFIEFENHSTAYKIVSHSIAAGDGYIKLDKDLTHDVAAGEFIKRVQNTGSYTFTHSISAVGRYAYIITNRESDPNIDLLSQTIEVVLYDIDDVYEQNEDILTAVGSAKDNSKIIV